MIKNKKQSIHGKTISRKQALRGLGNPSIWDAENKKIKEEFKQKPNQEKIHDFAIKELISLARRTHYSCEDSFYSCPKCPEFGGDNNEKCDCGADDVNARIEQIIKQLDIRN